MSTDRIDPDAYRVQPGSSVDLSQWSTNTTDGFNGDKQHCGNGNMIALRCPNRDKVNELHAKALALGGADEGAPGDRGGGFYGAYFRDLDGNKLCVFTMG